MEADFNLSSGTIFSHGRKDVSLILLNSSSYILHACSPCSLLISLTVYMYFNRLLASWGNFWRKILLNIKNASVHKCMERGVLFAEACCNSILPALTITEIDSFELGSSILKSTNSLLHILFLSLAETVAPRGTQSVN